MASKTAAKAAKSAEATLDAVPAPDPNSGVWVHGEAKLPSDQPAERVDSTLNEVVFAARIGGKCVYAGYSRGVPYYGECSMDELPVANLSVRDFLQGKLDESRRAAINDTARRAIAL